MDGSNPKVSFIPKGSLVREESFLERRRPQSAIGIIASIFFVLTVSVYAGLYYYNDVLNRTIVQKTTEIRAAQKKFSDAKEVGEARIFRARADLARALLNAHTVASPVFTFLSQNTTESILYDKFSFKNGTEGGVLDLSGEAPTYAALANQTDVFNKAKELAKFSVSNITLTKFGTVTFSANMTFVPEYLLYAKNLSSLNSANISSLRSTTPIEKPVATSSSIIVASTTSPVEVSAPRASTTPPVTSVSSSSPTATSNSIGGEWTVVSQSGTTTNASPQKGSSKQSFLQSLWLKFKFW